MEIISNPYLSLLWTEEQQTAYIEFILRGGRTAKVIYFNSPAFGSDRSDNNSGDLDDTILCVDGLQRLTAVLRFINNEIKAFGCYASEIEGRPWDHDFLRFNVNCLNKRADVLRWYIQFNDGGTPHSKEEIERVKRMLLLEETK